MLWLDHGYLEGDDTMPISTPSPALQGPMPSSTRTAAIPRSPPRRMAAMAAELAGMVQADG